MSHNENSPLEFAEELRYHDRFTDQPVTIAPPALAITAVKPPQFPPDNPIHFNQPDRTRTEDNPRSEPSLSDIGASFSGSSTRSHPGPHAHLNSSLPSSPDKSSAGAKGFMLASPVEAGLMESPSPCAHDLHTHRARLPSGTYKSRSSHLSEDNDSCRANHNTQNPVIIYTETKDPRPPEMGPNAVLLLVLLSLPVPLTAIATFLYTVFAVIFVLASSPLRIFPISYFRDTSLSNQVRRLLVPAIHLHERLILSAGYSLEVARRVSDSFQPDPIAPMSAYCPLRLILVLLVAPFLSFSLFIAVWIAAFFWVFAIVVGNPDGTDRRDDGRAAVLGVNAWWTSWLSRSRTSQEE